MKLAIKKEAHYIAGFESGSFHYMLMPIKFGAPGMEWLDPEMFELTGHVVVEVPDELGERLLSEAVAALRHQVEIAVLAEAKLKK